MNKCSKNTGLNSNLGNDWIGHFKYSYIQDMNYNDPFTIIKKYWSKMENGIYRLITSQYSYMMLCYKQEENYGCVFLIGYAGIDKPKNYVICSGVWTEFEV